ncbi:MAG: methyltransferase domain-containing protein [Propionivibrio sp.]
MRKLLRVPRMLTDLGITDAVLPSSTNLAAAKAALTVGYDHALNFVQRTLTDFRISGAVLPSSPILAAAMVAPAVGYGHVLELGAGRGAVTQALTQLVHADNLVAVELQPQLATFLRQRFPQLQVVQGTADRALDKQSKNEAIAVVSSLPFRSLPAAIRLATIRSVLRFLAESPGSTFIQFTYGLQEPFAAGAGFEWKPVRWVFANVPPARIWTLTKSSN